MVKARTSEVEMTALLPKYDSHRQRVYENRVLRKIYGLKKDETIRDWRKLHNEELHIL
jgi:hypothetical protein